MGERLRSLFLEGRLQEIVEEITDEMLDEFAIIGTYDDLAPKIRARYGGVASTLNFHFDIRDPQDEERLTRLIREIKRI